MSGLQCGHSLTGSTGTDAAGASGSSVDISKINNIPLLGHQGAGSITDITVRRLLTLQGAMKPDQIISLMSYKGQNSTLALPDHNNRIQVTYTPLFGANKKLSNEIKTILKPGQWIQLINRISQIPEPIVPITPSKYAVHTGRRALTALVPSFASPRSRSPGRWDPPTAATCSAQPGGAPESAAVLVLATLGAPERRRRLTQRAQV